MKRIIILSAIVIGLSGCSSDDPATNLPTPVTDATLNGTWLRVCDNNGSVSFNVTATLNNGSGSLFSTAYSDTTCTNTTMINSTIDFTYTLGNDVTVDGSVAGITTAMEINFDFTGGSPSFDLAAINNLNTLYFGDTDSDADFDGSTIAKRAIKMSAIPYIKQ